MIATLAFMALLYDADLSPTKPELVRDWLPRAPYGPHSESDVELVGAYRFDDPAGEVGVEIHLVRDDSGALLQVPLTYRPAPIPGAQLVTEMEHSVLGHRYIYDATTDPVFVQQLLHTIYTAGREVDQFLHVEGSEPKKLDNSVSVEGSGVDGEVPAVAGFEVVTEGTDTVIRAGDVVVVVHHRPLGDSESGSTLTGRWSGGEGVLASIR